ncbi:FAD-dependent oxidoreductase [Pseudomonas mediterranea]|uniref:NAD(P)/FAD-dependent oxidoreductase n=1 Tax=Pseudomonas mediterranea TaxID=183795 RepID=UPI0013171AB5|nr:FAD-binding oxidoreductase [Pseudomonas mediterranea]QHA82029.1 FAD-dependent oxidoreductase [Pseudomonas mediterranea]
MSFLFAEVDSYYAATAKKHEQFPSLTGVATADVCVIGAGFSGLNTAIELAERGLSVVILEAKRVAWAASGRNGGQLIRGCGHDLGKFERYIGADGVATLDRLGLDAVEIVKQRIAKYGIQCDLRWGFCELANTSNHYMGFIEEKVALELSGYPHKLELVPADEMARVVASDRYVGGLIDHGSGHLHPLNLALGEATTARALGVRIFENSAAINITYGNTIIVRTAHGLVRAKSLVLAGNAHLGELVPQLSDRVLPAGSYLIATEPLAPEEAEALIPANRALCDQRVGLDYYRLTADNRLLFGGACRYSGTDPSDIAAYMRPKMLRVFPQLAGKRIDYQWGGMIGIGANRLPQIGRLKNHANVYYAQAYSGHGLNMTHMAGRLVAEAIAQQHSGTGFDLFAAVPHKAFPGGRHLRAPLLALGMLWYRIKEMLGH